MPNLTADDAAAAVNTLNNAAVDRENDIIQYISGSDSSDIDGQFDSKTPVAEIAVIYRLLRISQRQ